MNFAEKWKSTFRGSRNFLLNPGSLSDEVEYSDLTASFRIFGLLILLYFGLNLLVSLFTLDDILQRNSEFERLLKNGELDSSVARFLIYPYNHIWILLITFLYITVATATGFLMLRFLGDRPKNFFVYPYVVLNSLVSVFGALICLSVLNQLFLKIYGTSDFMNYTIPKWTMLSIFSLGFLWMIKVYLQSSRTVLRQNIGRALITFLVANFVAMRVVIFII